MKETESGKTFITSLDQNHYIQNKIYTSDDLLWTHPSLNTYLKSKKHSYHIVIKVLDVNNTNTCNSSTQSTEKQLQSVLIFWAEEFRYYIYMNYGFPNEKQKLFFTRKFIFTNN